MGTQVSREAGESGEAVRDPKQTARKSGEGRHGESWDHCQKKQEWKCLACLLDLEIERGLNLLQQNPTETTGNVAG